MQIPHCLKDGQFSVVPSQFRIALPVSPAFLDLPLDGPGVPSQSPSAERGNEREEKEKRRKELHGTKRENYPI